MTLVVDGIEVSGALADVETSFRHRFGALVLGEFPPIDLHPGDAGQVGESTSDVFLDLGPKRTSRRRQCDLEGDDAVVGDVCALGHPEFDDVGAELGIDHAAHQTHDMVCGGGRGGHALRIGPTVAKELAGYRRRNIDRYTRVRSG